MPEYGDWYARNMYIEGHWQYNYHVEHFGHPSEYGYKDICNDWVIDKWNPEELMKLYMDMGARYFMAMGGIMIILIAMTLNISHGILFVWVLRWIL